MAVSHYSQLRFQVELQKMYKIDSHNVCVCLLRVIKLNVQFSLRTFPVRFPVVQVLCTILDIKLFSIQLCGLFLEEPSLMLLLSLV